MLSPKMVEAINEQINCEMYSAYLYLSMSNHANSMGLKGMAHWFLVQYHEEMLHSMKFYEYIQRQGGRPILKPIPAPPASFDSALDMYEKTLEHERFITSSLNNLMEIAKQEKDNATQILLQWYITEQIEEEENDNDIINQLRLIGSDARAILMIDKDLATRTVAVPTDYSNGVQAAMAAMGLA